MRAVCFFLGLVLVACLCGNAAAAPAGRPETVLTAIQKAIDTQDMKAFERHVDMDSLLEQGASSVVNTLQQVGTIDTSGLPPLLALMASSIRQPEMARQVKMLLKSEVESFVRYGVTSGAFAGKKPSGSPDGLIAPLMRDVSTGRKELKRSAAVRKEASGSYVVPAVIHDYGNGRDYRVDLRVRAEQDVWKVQEIANMDRLLEKLRKEAAE